MMNRFLDVGDVFEVKKGMHIFTKIPEMMAYSNGDSWDLVEKDVIVDMYPFLEGFYVVTHTGNHSSGQASGYKVWAENLEKKVSINFFQSGGFICKNEPDKIVLKGKAERTWDWEIGADWKASDNGK